MHLRRPTVKSIQPSSISCWTFRRVGEYLVGSHYAVDGTISCGTKLAVHGDHRIRIAIAFHQGSSGGDDVACGEVTDRETES